MDDMFMNGDILKIDLPLHQSSYIKVIGVGGGGSNAVNHMYKQGIVGVDFIVCNTDAKSLDMSPVPKKIQLGKGLGAGNVPSVAEKCADEKREEIKEMLSSNTQMLFITAGMGGGTGTGASPVIAKIAKEIELTDEVKKILIVAIVTTPFSFEGPKRVQHAKEGIAELKKYVDAILVINNDKLRDFGNLPMRQAFSHADNILTTAAKCISEIITVGAHIQIDFKDVNTVMSNSGVALMGYGKAEGENRAIEAVKQAINSPLLNDNNINGAKSILLYIASASGEKGVTMDELSEITSFITKETGGDSDFIWGDGTDDTLGDALAITLVATGFKENEIFEEVVVPIVKTETKQLGPILERCHEEKFVGKNDNLTNFELASEREKRIKVEMEQARAEAERIAAEKLEAERMEAERLEAERMEAERLEAERVEAERLEAERLAQERVEMEMLEAERIAAEKLEAERMEAERLEAERMEAEKAQQEQEQKDLMIAELQAKLEALLSSRNSVASPQAEEQQQQQQQLVFASMELDENIQENEERQNEETPVICTADWNEEAESDENAPAFEFSTSSSLLDLIANLPDVDQVQSPASSIYDLTEVAEDRAKKLREISQNISSKIRTPEGLEEIENVPAYKRRNVELQGNVIAASTVEVSKQKLGANGLFSANSYLHDNVD